MVNGCYFTYILKFVKIKHLFTIHKDGKQMFSDLSLVALTQVFAPLMHRSKVYSLGPVHERARFANFQRRVLPAGLTEVKIDLNVDEARGILETSCQSIRRLVVKFERV